MLGKEIWCMILVTICWSIREERSKRLIGVGPEATWCCSVKIIWLVVFFLWKLSSILWLMALWLGLLYPFVVVELSFLYFFFFWMLPPFLSCCSLYVACLMLHCSCFKLFNIYFLSFRKTFWSHDTWFYHYVQCHEEIFHVEMERRKMIQAFLDFEEWIMAIHRKFEANKEQHKEDSLLKTESSKKHEPTSKEVS